jgi:pyruvate dehydrogenase (quinone)/pyruvate oxidase
MGQIAADVMITRLAAWGVDTVFGIPGDGINGIMEGKRRQSKKIKFILVHHEEAAAFMATAYAKQTGRIGVCLATSGPGAIHLLNGLYDAKLDHVPVLAITGMQETSVLGTGYQQEVHLEHLFQDVAEYNQMIINAAQLPALVDIAIRTAYSRRGVAHLTLPNDIQIADAGDNPWPSVAPANPPSTAPILWQPRVRPSDPELDGAAAILNQAKKPAILAGIGARGASSLLERLAETLGAPVIKTLSGKMVLPDDSPYTTGGIGLLGTGPTADLIDEVDTLLMVGTNFPYTKHLPAPGRVKVVQVDIDPTRIGNRLPTDAPLVGDVSTTLEALLPRLQVHSDHSHLNKYQHEMADWRDKMAALESPERDPIAPQYVVSLLDELAADDAVMTCDAGTIATWAARHWTIRGNREFYLSGNLASMAPGLPYAIGIAHVNPGRQVIAYVGDGGFAMLMAEFNTACRYRLPVKVIINNNSSLGQILWEQMVLGYPEHGVRFENPQPDYAAWATACGGFGIRVDKADNLQVALSEALASPGPAIVDVAVDPNEPPMPGKVTYEQAKKFTEAFLKGQPQKAAIATTLFKDRIQQLKA